MNTLTHYIPIFTTLFACWFAPQLYARWRSKRPAPHLLWWFVGVLVFAAGTITESSTTLFGWNPVVFRAWYITGALLGGAPLAQGTAYLLLSRRTANIITLVLGVLVVTASIGVILSPLDATLVEPHRLSGRVLIWSWVRAFSPFINTYSLVMLVGGALVSAERYYWKRANADKVCGNIAIAVGALLPGNRRNSDPVRSCGSPVCDGIAWTCVDLPRVPSQHRLAPGFVAAGAERGLAWSGPQDSSRA